MRIELLFADSDYEAEALADNFAADNLNIIITIIEGKLYLGMDYDAVDEYGMHLIQENNFMYVPDNGLNEEMKEEIEGAIRNAKRFP